MAGGNPAVQTVDETKVTESVKYSWYNDADENKPPTTADTQAQYPKGVAYSWLKAPRYNGAPCEVGPLARMTVNGDYNNGVSALDRHAARARETLKIALAMRGWLEDLRLLHAAECGLRRPDRSPARRAGPLAPGVEQKDRPLPSRHADVLESFSEGCQRSARPAGASAHRHAGREHRHTH